VASEAKPFASLSSGLLARKGAARPAMRPQGFGQIGNGLEDLGWNDMGIDPQKAVEVQRDVGSEVFGEDVVGHPRAHPTGLTPVQSPVHSQQAEIEDRFGSADPGEDEDIDETAEIHEPEARQDEAGEAAAVVVPMAVSVPRRTRRPRTAAGTKAKAAFTLRLDPERHFKLRLACAVDGRSAQQLVTDALDQLLERMPELTGLAAKAKRRG
jgi:hypothetical protein